MLYNLPSNERMKTCQMECWYVPAPGRLSVGPTKGLRYFRDVWRDVSQVAGCSFSAKLWRHPRAANTLAFAVLRSKVLRVWMPHRRFSDAVRLTVLSKVFCKACSTFSLLLYSFFSFLISLAGWLLTTGLYPDNLWMTTFTCTAML